MKVYGFMVGEDGKVMELENTLKEEQGFVGGRIERLSFTEALDLICMRKESYLDYHQL